MSSRKGMSAGARRLFKELTKRGLSNRALLPAARLVLELDDGARAKIERRQRQAA